MRFKNVKRTQKLFRDQKSKSMFKNTCITQYHIAMLLFLTQVLENMRTGPPLTPPLSIDPWGFTPFFH